MKLLVCCLMIVANISNNGKASLESYTPTSANMLFEDTTKNTDTSCNRPCKFNVKPRKCYFDFTIEPTLEEDGRPTLTINGATPGPPITVCVNDIIVVEVKNKIPDQDLTIHWHGVEQKGTPHMDGVPMVTQCPIGYGATYKYAFIASMSGTYFYHADSVSHHSDGIYGSLIVNQIQPLEPHFALYDYDRSVENTLLISAKYPQLLTGNLEDMSQVSPSSLIINGVENYKMFVMQGFAYRMRLINAVAIECPVVVKIDNHEMVVIATDSRPVKPVATGTVQLYPGERMDVVVRATQDTGGYWVRVSAAGVCAGLQADAMMLYSGFNYTSMLQKGQKEAEPKTSLDFGSPVYGQILDSLQDVPQSPKVRTVYLGIDRNKVNLKDKDVDFRYISDAIPKKPFYPGSFELKDSVVQINGKSFLYPNAPMLLYPRDVKADFTCKVEDEAKNQEPQCVMVLEPNEEEVLELALVNEGFGSNDTYTFHMHGYTMQVVSTWQNPEGKPISKDQFLQLHKEGKVRRNVQNPPLKDTITVPNKGYTIVRIRPDHGGSWLLECRSCSLSSLPAALIINVPQKMPKAIVKSLAKCGNYRPPDVLLN